MVNTTHAGAVLVNVVTIVHRLTSFVRLPPIVGHFRFGQWLMWLANSNQRAHLVKFDSEKGIKSNQVDVLVGWIGWFRDESTYTLGSVFHGCDAGIRCNYVIDYVSVV